MAKGQTQKPDNLKANEVVKASKPEVKATDDLSNVDKGHDYVKAGETAQVAHGIVN